MSEVSSFWVKVNKSPCVFSTHSLHPLPGAEMGVLKIAEPCGESYHS